MLLILAIAIAGAAILSHTAPRPMLFEAFRPNGSVWRMPAAAGDRPRVYLTFDDGPNLAWTPPLLDALRDEGATATFFLIDDRITDESVAIVRRIAEDGHAIGLHSGTRRLMLMPSERTGGRARSRRRPHRGDHRRRPVPPVQAACRLAQRLDVRRPARVGIPAGRLELGHVGL